MRLKITLILVITAVCLGAVLWGLDLSEARQALASVRWGFLDRKSTRLNSSQRL